MRHPKHCIYHLRFGHCKFGENCSFFHCQSETEVLKLEITKLKEAFQAVLESLKYKDNEIEMLCKRIEDVEEIPLRELESKFKCTHCDYSSNSSVIVRL